MDLSIYFVSILFFGLYLYLVKEILFFIVELIIII